MERRSRSALDRGSRLFKLLGDLVDLVGIEPTTSSMPWKRAPSCATGPRWGHYRLSLAEGLKYSRRPSADSQREQIRARRQFSWVLPNACEMIGTGTRRSSAMKYRIAIWAGVGLLVAAGWALYALATKPPALSLSDPLWPLVRLTCPIAILGSSYPISLYSALLANAATYALAGLMVETLRQRLHPAK